MRLLLTLLLGAFFLLGALLIRQSHKHADLVEAVSVSIALGSLSALGLFDMLPELMEGFTDGGCGLTCMILTVLSIAFGFLLLVLLDHFIPEHEAADDSEEHRDENAIHVGIMSSLAIVLHNILEGMAVYSLTENDLMSGIAFGIGIGLHNIPMGMFIYSMMKHDKRHVKYVVLTAASLSTFIGGLVMATLSALITESIQHLLIGAALGMLLYIVLIELIPYVRKNLRKDLLTAFGGIAAGAILVLLSLTLG